MIGLAWAKDSSSFPFRSVLKIRVAWRTTNVGLSLSLLIPFLLTWWLRGRNLMEGLTTHRCHISTWTRSTWWSTGSQRSSLLAPINIVWKYPRFMRLGWRSGTVWSMHVLLAPLSRGAVTGALKYPWHVLWWGKEGNARRPDEGPFS